MKFHFENLGSIKKADVELGNLTVVCGKNNTGKTYLTYAVCEVLETINKYQPRSAFKIGVSQEQEKRIKQELEETGKSFLEYEYIIKEHFLESIPLIIQEALNGLSDYFQFNEKAFSNTVLDIDIPSLEFFLQNKIDDLMTYFTSYGNDASYTLEITKTAGNTPFSINLKTWDEVYPAITLIMPMELTLSNYIYEKYLKTTLFILTAQRDAIHLFQKEIDKNRYKLVEQLRKEKRIELIDEYSSSYAKPIENNIDFVRELPNKNLSSFAKAHPEIIDYIEKMLGVKYEFFNNQLTIIDSNSQKQLLPNMVSTSVRALADLFIWLKFRETPHNFVYKCKEFLFIDEPELNLHPENQVKLARLLVKLVNAGIKVWITTHSDYIVKELNNLLVLSNEFEGKEAVMTELGYEESDILQKEDARFYITYYDKDLQGCTVEQVKIDEFGLQKSAFDEAMLDIDNRTDKIFSSLEQQKEKEYQHESHISQVAES